MISQEIKDKIISLRKEGKTYNEIHNLTGVAKSTISDICRPLNLGGNIIIELTPELIQKAQELYNEIGNIKTVAKQLGIGWERLSKVVILNKVSKQPISESQRVIDWRKRKKLELIEYKGGKCQICGYNKCSGALEFHHLDPMQKDFQISACSKSFETLKQEVDKCILVCANCHREIHAGITEIPQNFSITINEAG